MKGRGEAFYSERSRTYMLAGVLFERPGDAVGDAAGDAAAPPADLSEELLRVLTAL